MSRIKICGITRIEDALSAVDLGAAAIGFVFWPGSPRFIEPVKAREIAQRLPPLVTAVGVFVDQPADHVIAVARLVGLGAVQLHGDEDLAYCRGLDSPVIKAASVEGAARLVEWPDEIVLLLDAVDPVRRGGTGQTVDWTRAAALARRRRVVLSGGLKPENIGDAIRSVRPFGLDVSSGVEASPGIKDAARMQALFAAAAAVGGVRT